MSYFDKPTFEEDPAALSGLGCGSDGACQKCRDRASRGDGLGCGGDSCCQNCREVTARLGERYVSDDDDDEEEDDDASEPTPPSPPVSRERTGLPPTRMRSGFSGWGLGEGGEGSGAMSHGYSRGTAAVYDRAVGHSYFLRARQRFERVMAAHRAHFASAADVGCGTGLFACYLRDRWGVPVFAVDRSAGMLEEARARCGARPGITLLRQDVRALALPRQVHLVAANFDMLNHLARYVDLDSAVRAVAANLAAGGWFYFDLLTPCLPLAGFDAIVRRVRMPGTTFEQRAVWLPRRRLIGVQARIRTRRGTSSCQVAEWHIERAYGPEEIGRALRDAGLVTRGVYDEDTLGPARDCPARLIILAQKP